MSRIAIIEPLGDLGIGTYAYELAEALVDEGVEVDVYTAPNAGTLLLPRRHGFFPVLGSALVRQRQAVTTAPRAAPSAAAALARATGAPPAQRTSGALPLPRFLKGALRESYVAIELACWLRVRGYDIVWTQWPNLTPRAVSLWTASRAVGLRIVHTAHNVYPHERTAGDRARYGLVYARSDRILVHSEMARDALAREFPQAARKVVVQHHGLYTTYPRDPAARDCMRRQLGVGPDTTLALFFGGVRPYKNVDAAIGAIAADSSRTTALLVAGWEMGYPDSDARDPLGRTRRLAEQAGVLDRVHLRPGPFGYAETSALFEASDVVLLPYLESYGSGLLLLAMSFGKHVVITRTGGMEEYMERYPAHVLLDASSGGAVSAAVQETRERLRTEPPGPRLPELEWRHIVRELLPHILR